MTPEQKQPEKKSHEGFVEVLRHHKWDFASYLALFIGLLLSIFHHFIGGLLVGLVLGIYFSHNIFDAWKKFREYLLSEGGIFRGFVMIAAGLALFIASPGLCIGTVVGAYGAPYIINLVNRISHK